MSKKKGIKKILLITNINFFFFKDRIKKLYFQNDKVRIEIDSVTTNSLNQNKNEYDNVIVNIDPTFMFDNLTGYIDRSFKYNFSKYLKFLKITNNQILKKYNNSSNITFVNYYNYSPFFLEDFYKQANQNLINIKSKNISIIDIVPFYKNYGESNIISRRNEINFHNPFIKKYEFLYAKYIYENLYFFKTPKKIIVFDCDNTLWGGIIGEDGIKKIEFCNKSTKGKIFSVIHNYINNFLQKGILVSVCSKNNLKDVKSVFKNEKFNLNFSKLISPKINWKDKFVNILDLSKNINLSLDSFIFIDDNDFEIDLMKKKLPEVTCFQVPRNIYEYPLLLKKIDQQFFSKIATKEDKLRNNSYLLDVERNNLKQGLKDLDVFFSKLKIKIQVKKNDKNNINRISQMCHRVNQFNFTTKRYTENNIKTLFKNKENEIFTFDISDKFGDYGTTALAICKKIKKEKLVELDTFLMSCRVLGKKIENNIFMFLIEYFKRKNYINLKVNYIKTLKNIILSDFIKQIEMSSKVKKHNSNKEFIISMKDYKINKLNNYEIIFAKQKFKKNNF